MSASRAGDVLGPFESNGELTVLAVRFVEQAVLPDFAASHDLAIAAYRRTRVDDGMRAYLARLRDRSTIVVRDDVVGSTDAP